MYGAILGDMIGAPYEFDRGAKVKDFPLFSAGLHFTDDSVMTVAVAEALMATLGKDEKVVKMVLIDAMRAGVENIQTPAMARVFSCGWRRSIQIRTAATAMARRCACRR